MEHSDGNNLERVECLLQRLADSADKNSSLETRLSESERRLHSLEEGFNRFSIFLSRTEGFFTRWGFYLDMAVQRIKKSVAG